MKIVGAKLTQITAKGINKMAKKKTDKKKKSTKKKDKEK